MNQFTEDNLVEQTVIKLIKDVWGDSSCHINAFTDLEDAKLGRDSRGEVILKKFLLPALEKINPELPLSALEEAISELTRDRSHLGTEIVKANQEIYKLLRDGASVTIFREDGKSDTANVKFFDFENPKNNHFLAVTQLWVTGEMYTKRPDLIIFVNGIPLTLMEFKASHKPLINAYQENIKDYKDTISKLLTYNMGVVLSNGIESKLGSITSPFEYFHEWKKAESEDETPNSDLATFIKGTCNKERLIDIFENFVLFDCAKGKIKKIVPRYFQYYGVNRAFERVIKRDELDGKLGVYWHTQGSGKSYSMVFLSQKVLRKLTGDFTFVIVTDRNQLDGQAYGNFATVGAVYEKEVRADSIINLKELLKEDHRQIFTTIQKFQDIDAAVSERSDIIIMTDEAHRTQYDKMAQNMRKTLPNASFIGFTGTPLMSHGEERTQETFGKYVSVYNFGQSVADKSTVPLYYENRVPKLINVNDNLEKELQEVMDFYDLNNEEEEKIEQEFSTFYHLITREDRLNAIARDIVQHFVGRGYNGKAMVISVDKKTTFRMYDKVKKEWDRYIAKLRMDLSRTNDEFEQQKILDNLEKHENIDMAVVVSPGQNEIADMEEFEIDIRPIRQKMLQEDLEEEFKKEDSDLKIVFVCAMWLTGFDVPTLSTLYLDKPLQNHTLMQTITRANRIAEGKTNGLIVDYIGVFKNVQKALALYASTNTSGAIIRDKQELVEDLKFLLNKVDDFLKAEQISLGVLLQAPPEQKLLLLEKYANTLVSSLDKKKFFLDLSSDVYNAYLAILPDPKAEDFYHTVTAIKVISSRMREGMDNIDVSYVKRDLESLLDKSIQTGEYVIPKQRKLKDLSALDADALHKFFFDLENKNLQVDALASELEQKIEEMIKKNKSRLRFMERLKSMLSEYNSGAHDIDQLFDDLMDLANSLNEEQQRSVKENLTEEELAVFDILLKESMNPKERDKVKKVAKVLMAKLKEEKLVLDWREKEITRAGVKTEIYKILYADLPEPIYTDKDCQIKGLAIYNFIYEHYNDARNFMSN